MNIGSISQLSNIIFQYRLGDVHVGFGRLDFPALRLSVVGGRPFSMGGERIHSAYNPFAALLGPRLVS